MTSALSASQYPKSVGYEPIPQFLQYLNDCFRYSISIYNQSPTPSLQSLQSMCIPGVCGEPVEPPTRCASASVIALQVMNAFQLVILISAFVTGDTTNGIISILFVLILFCAWRFLQYRIVIFYMFFCCFLFVFSLVALLTIAQNGTVAFPGEMNSAKTAFQLIYCVYYFSASIICFFIYREFKAIAFEKNPSIFNYFQQRQNSMNDQQQPASYTADNNFAPSYGAPQYNNQRPNQNRNNSRQLVQVFQGRGVVIGGN